MFVELIDVGRLFDRFHFEPAKVQRQYVWQMRQANVLLEDLLQAFQSDAGREYYLGPILLAKGENPGEAWVFDGQQRITTLTILMAAIGRAPTLEESSLQRQNAARLSRHGNRPRIYLRTLGGALTRVANGSHQPGRSDNTVADHQIYGIERAFLRRLSSIKNLQTFVDWMTSKAVFNVVWADMDQGLILFDRANNRGIHLHWHELVKGVVNEALSSHSLPTTGFTEQWYKTQREAGREFEDLLWSIATWRYEPPKRDEPMDKDWAQAEFENDFGTGQTKEAVAGRVKDFLRQMESCRKSSEKLDDLRSKDLSFKGDPSLAQLMFLEFPEWKPAAYWILVHRPNNADVGLRRLRRAAYIAHLLGWQSRKSWLSRFFLMELDRERNANTAYQFSPRQLAQARGTLRASMTDSSQYRPLVKLYESDLANSKGLLKPRQIFLAHVEHILPRAPDGAWLDQFPDENERAELRGRIGNFCLLPKEVNEDLGNDQWGRKRNAYRKIDKCFRGAIDAASYERWNADAINKRTQNMAEYLDDLLELGRPAQPHAEEDFEDDEIPF
ncbi:DUF262 domain-containing HNH endonuclease family protein [Hyphomonas sp.]|uniref:DUF262 domain-containing protein n=1 Tax=Hyphomonas sp. TaxID=87 RepID=UPI0025C18745|nr:DUF262 domain-containing HNH endonuclease family protein [Hyphomonas sp.]